MVMAAMKSVLSRLASDVVVAAVAQSTSVPRFGTMDWTLVSTSVTKATMTMLMVVISLVGLSQVGSAMMDDHGHQMCVGIIVQTGCDCTQRSVTITTWLHILAGSHLVLAMSMHHHSKVLKHLMCYDRMGLTIQQLMAVPMCAPFCLAGTALVVTHGAWTTASKYVAMARTTDTTIVTMATLILMMDVMPAARSSLA